MRISAVSKTLLMLGAFVGAVTGIALALGVRPDRLPSWMITVGMYKLAFIAAGGLFVAGALIGRAAQERSRRHRQADADTRLLVDAPPSLGSDRASRQPDPLTRDRRNV
jgi:hypothetical protein